MCQQSKVLGCVFLFLKKFELSQQFRNFRFFDKIGPNFNEVNVEIRPDVRIGYGGQPTIIVPLAEAISWCQLDLLCWTFVVCSKSDHTLV